MSNTIDPTAPSMPTVETVPSQNVVTDSPKSVEAAQNSDVAKELKPTTMDIDTLITSILNVTPSHNDRVSMLRDRSTLKRKVKYDESISQDMSEEAKPSSNTPVRKRSRPNLGKSSKDHTGTPVVYQSKGQKRYLCTICTRDYSTVRGFQRHYMVHTDMPPAGCKFCDFQSHRLDQLKSHHDKKHKYSAKEPIEFPGARSISSTPKTPERKRKSTLPENVTATPATRNESPNNQDKTDACDAPLPTSPATSESQDENDDLMTAESANKIVPMSEVVATILSPTRIEEEHIAANLSNVASSSQETQVIMPFHIKTESEGESSAIQRNVVRAPSIEEIPVQRVKQEVIPISPDEVDTPRGETILKNKINLKTEQGTLSNNIIDEDESIQFVIRQYTTTQPTNLFVVWDEEFTQDVAYTVLKNSSNCILAVRKCGYTSFGKFCSGYVKGAVECPMVKLEAENSSLHILAFGARTHGMVKDETGFKTLADLEKYLRELSENKKIAHIVRYSDDKNSLCSQLVNHVKNQIIRTNKMILE